MSQEISQEEFDKKVTRAVKYGIPLGLIVASIVIVLDFLTGAKGELALYVAIAISVGGFVLGIGAILYGLVKLHYKGANRNIKLLILKTIVALSLIAVGIYFIAMRGLRI